MEHLPDKLDSNSLILEGKYLHMRCAAHILNLIVKDGMDIMEKSIEQVHDSVAYWSATPKRHEKFEKMARTLNIEYKKRLLLDCKTRWNSTYIMLSIALEYVDIFEKLNGREKLYSCCPTKEDWNIAKELCCRLKVFYDVTEVFSGTKYVTANLFFPKICGIQLAIQKWSASDNKVVQKMSEQMKHKFDKYWKDVHGLMSIATVLDPRYKLHMLQALFGSLYGVEYADVKVDEVMKLMANLLEEYREDDEILATSEVVGTAVAQVVGADDVVNIFDQYMSSKSMISGSQVRTELDLYLEEQTIKRVPHKDMDIISWWKIAGAKYPTLQKIAQDILPIPVTSVASESAFSISGRLLSSHRSRLVPSMAEAFMCMQAWSRADMIGNSSSQIATIHLIHITQQLFSTECSFIT
uniref:Zinc finger BED domain-containing protein RICESLEEPER 2-like n=1 Tax=Hordeum vulgare subsp. vulgare TaxID=112509 RepID=A0A8I6XFG0_HORVV